MDQQSGSGHGGPAVPAPTARLALAAAAAADADADAAAAGLEVDLDMGHYLDEDRAMLRDAAAVLAARRRLDGLLAQLAAQPFSASAYGGLRAYLAGPADRALAAYQRMCAATATRGQ